MDTSSLLFLLKKTAAAFLTPPGIFVVLILLAALWAQKRLKIVLFGIAAVMYATSIAPVKDLILAPLEQELTQPSLSQVRERDVYIVLGGGFSENVPDLLGPGTLSEGGLERTVTALRLYRLAPRPILLTGGTSDPRRRSESDYARQWLIAMGVRKEDIIASPKSGDLDTLSNARLARTLLSAQQNPKILLITSAYHMNRSLLIFRTYFSSVLPYPTGFRVSRTKYRYSSFLPDASSFFSVSLAAKEYLGILFYRLSPTLRSSTPPT